MTPFWIGIILIAGGIAFAAAPLLRRRQRDRAPQDPATAPRWVAAPEGQDVGVASSRHREARRPADPSLVAALEELELDRAMGKMSEDDYRALRAALERTPRVSVPEPPAQLSAEESATPAAQPQELKPAAAISGTPVPAQRDTDDEAERLVRSLRAHVTSCPDCGPRPEPHAAYCSNCGMALLACPQCAHPIAQAGARFCDRCGSPLTR
jgi:hypothetical protein